MPQNFDFRFVPKSATGGWTAASIASRAPGPTAPQPQPSAVGPVNALAQNSGTAASLMTDPTIAVDPVLGSRLFKNPNTGIRDPVASGSVYAMSNVPAYLSQTVAALNEEQGLRRALQAEWNNRLLGGVAAGGPESYIFGEALRAASVSPGASVGFGQQIADPTVGRAQILAAQTEAKLEADRMQAFQELERVRRRLATTPNNSPDRFALMTRAQQLQPAASYVGRSGGSGWGGGWSPRPTNSFQPGYNQAWGIGF